MPRPRQRVRLEDGLKLDVNKLVREGFLQRGNEPLTFGTQWTSNRQGLIASAVSTIRKERGDRGSLRITVVGKREQHLELVAAVTADEPDGALVPPARRGDIGDLDHRHDQHGSRLYAAAGSGPPEGVVSAASRVVTNHHAASAS